MARRPSLPASLRRAANRAAGPRGKAPSERLQAAADVGILTRSNTKAGTAGRRAVDAVTYRRRVGSEPELSAREAAGHRVAGSRDRAATFLTSTPGPRVVTVSGAGVSLLDVHRAARYMGDLGALLADLSAASGNAARVGTIKRTWERRMAARAPIAGLALLADADAAVALADQVRGAEGDLLVFDSGTSRPGRRRRSTGGPRRRSTGDRGGSRRGGRGTAPEESEREGILGLLDDVLGEIGDALEEGSEALGEGWDEL